MTEELVRALNFLKDELTRAEPVRISTDQSTTWFTFTDRAYEPGSDTPGTIGGSWLTSGVNQVDGGTSLAAGIVREFVSYEKKFRLLPWFGRVPSISNPADSASRLDFDTPWLQGANHLQLVLPDHMSQWGVSTPEAKCRSPLPKQNDLSVNYG